MDTFEVNFDLAIMPALIISAIYQEGIYNKCPQNLGTWYLHVTVIATVLIIIFNNAKALNDIHLAESMYRLAVFFYFVYNAIGTYKYIYLLFSDHSCFSGGVFTILGINFGLFLLLVSAIIVLICTEANRSAARQRHVLETKEEYFQLLDKIMVDKDFNVEEFIQKNREFIDLVELLEEDIKLLKEYCFKKYSLRESSTNSDSCAICIGDFEMDEEVVEHPICRHTYHWECLEVWLKNKRNCPICKGGTRINLIRHLGRLRDAGVELQEIGREEEGRVGLGEGEMGPGLGDEGGQVLREEEEQAPAVNQEEQQMPTVNQEEEQVSNLGNQERPHLREEEQRSVPGE